MLFRVRVPTLNRCIMNSPFNQLKDEGAGTREKLATVGESFFSLNCEAVVYFCSVLRGKYWDRK